VSRELALELLERLRRVEARVDGLLEASGLTVPVRPAALATTTDQDPETTTAPMAVH